MLLPRARAPLNVVGKPFSVEISISVTHRPVLVAKFRREPDGSSRLDHVLPDGTIAITTVYDAVARKVMMWENGGEVLEHDVSSGPAAIPKLDEWTYDGVIAFVTGERKEILGFKCTHVELRSPLTDERAGSCWIDFEQSLVVLDSDLIGGFWRVTA